MNFEFHSESFQELIKISPDSYLSQRGEARKRSGAQKAYILFVQLLFL